MGRVISAENFLNGVGISVAETGQSFHFVDAVSPASVNVGAYIGIEDFSTFGKNDTYLPETSTHYVKEPLIKSCTPLVSRLQPSYCTTFP